MPPRVMWLTDRHRSCLLAPAPVGEGVCAVCLTACPGHHCCHRCHRQPAAADAVLPVSYSIHGSALHRILRLYKRSPRWATRHWRLLLGAIAWRFLVGHEACLARAAGVPGFERVCIVPSGRQAAPLRHPLAGVLAAVDPIAERFDWSILTSDVPAARGRRFDPLRFRCPRPSGGQAVLLVDDTWTTGASAQSAAAVLKRSGAAAVGVLVIARHIRADHARNREWLAQRCRPFDWKRCALCEPVPSSPRVRRGTRSEESVAPPTARSW